MPLDWDLDLSVLTPRDRIVALRAVEREISRFHALEIRLIADIAAEEPIDSAAPEVGKEMAKEELRAALGESAVSVNNRIRLAREVTGRLPDTLAALESGHLTLRHVRLLVDAVLRLDDAAASAVEAAAVPFAAGRDLAAFGRKVRREALKADPRTAEEQHRAALEDRRVWSRADDHGTSFVGAIVPAEGAQALLAGLDVVADRSCRADDARTHDQRRADALVQLGVDALNGYPTCPNCATRLDGGKHGVAPRRQGLRPAVQVSVALSTLLGLDEQPGELDGYGPIPAGLARRLAADPTGTWRRLVTDPVGRLVDYGRTRYRPPADLRDYVIARDRTCRFPACNRRACRCDLDHVRAWVNGGSTAADNLVALRLSRERRRSTGGRDRALLLMLGARCSTARVVGAGLRPAGPGGA